MILGAVYNGNIMMDVNFEEVPLDAYTKSEEISVPVTVNSLESLSVSAMAWESFDTCKPILEKIEY